MAARRSKKESLKAASKSPPSKKASDEDKAKNEQVRKEQHEQLVAEHLPPLALVFTVLACSGALWILAMRDVLATGRVIAGVWDEAMLLFTKSMEFFNNEKGWKSSQGGLSSIQQVTTDANNMGGLFVRKMGGAAVAAVHTQKLLPLLFHPQGAQWKLGHFQPLLRMAILGNLSICCFYGLYLEDLTAAGAETMAQICMAVLLAETCVMFFYLVTLKKSKTHAVAMPDGKTPKSATSNIVRNTVGIVSGAIAVIAVRDLFFPGFIFDFIPRDDIYLEWTGAFFHSPPEGSEEAERYSIEAALFIGEKFLSQLLALHLLIGCMYKFATAFLIRYGSDGSGLHKCKMIWMAQAFGDGLLVFICRLFAQAASTASLDLRWHLMCLGYEMFVLFIYGFF